MYCRQAVRIPFWAASGFFVSWVFVLLLYATDHKPQAIKGSHLRVFHPRISVTEADEAIDALLKAHAELRRKPQFLGSCLLANGKFENDFILEWLFYHSLLGFQSALIHEHMNLTESYLWQSSGSPMKQLLLPLIQSGYVHYSISVEDYGFDESVRQLHRSCWKPDGPAVWRTEIDGDEMWVFLPFTSLSVKDLIHRYRSLGNPFPLHEWLSRASSHNIAAIVPDRVSFVPQGYWETPTGLQMNNYVYRQVTMQNTTKLGKVLARPREMQWHIPGNHWMQLMPNSTYHIADAMWTPITTTKVPAGHLEPLRLNHYVTRSYIACEQRAASQLNMTKGIGWRAMSANSGFCKRMLEPPADLIRTLDYTIAESVGAQLTERMIERFFSGTLLL